LRPQRGIPAAAARGGTSRDGDGAASFSREIAGYASVLGSAYSFSREIAGYASVLGCENNNAAAPPA
ncbi:MAG: hypothetical protein MJZ04_04125, partial [Bacteroidales bacterium]|nr:hypothetical protein [Bacteroidales bacterium]